MEPIVKIAEGAAGELDPDAGLRSVAALAGALRRDRLELLQVQNARSLGWSWQDIAERLGVTKQTVHLQVRPPDRGPVMFERFTDDARAVVRCAIDSASRLRGIVTSGPSTCC